MQRKAGPQAGLALVSSHECGVQRRRTGRDPLCPAAAEDAGETIEKPKAVMLRRDKADRRHTRRGEAGGQRKSYLRAGLQPDKQNKTEPGIGELGEKLEGEVDDRAGRRDRARYSGERQRAHAEDAAADR